MSENPEENQPDLIETIKEWVITKFEITRLSVIERLTVVVSALITISCVVIAGILTFLFASITLALFLGEVIGSYAAGFGIVALLYLLIALTLVYFKERFIDKRLQDFIVNMIFKKKKKDGEEL